MVGALGTGIPGPGGRALRGILGGRLEGGLGIGGPNGGAAGRAGQPPGIGH